jgi:hypothetical protein
VGDPKPRRRSDRTIRDTGENDDRCDPLARQRRNGGEVRTVIVRLFEPAPGTGPVGLRGIVEDLVGGTSERFSGPVELLDVIEGIAAAPLPAPRAPRSGAPTPGPDADRV